LGETREMSRMNQLSEVAGRVLFVLALALVGLAAWEKLANLFGRHLTFLGEYLPSRLLEYAAVSLLFVIALQLREIKHLLRPKRPVT
jgi:hypothetical protein